MTTDPDALLAQARAAVRILAQADAHDDDQDGTADGWPPTEEEIADAQHKLFTAFVGLDDELTHHGGFPEDWREYLLSIAVLPADWRRLLLTVADVQAIVARVWTLDGYGPAFCACTLPTRDFGHALGHVQKAAGRLFEVVDAYDHGRSGEPPAIGKYLADLVICAARLASTAPGGAVDLVAAVRERLAEISERGASARRAIRPETDGEDYAR